MSANTLRAYKAIFILDSRNYEQEIDTLVEKLKAVLAELEAEVTAVKNHGRLDFVRVTDRNHVGDYYVEISCQAASTLPAALHERLRLDKNVKRVQVESLE